MQLKRIPVLASCVKKRREIKINRSDFFSLRFRKIAADLGGRTSLQVQSRVQKYFIKLAKAGLPIPGRMPRSDRWLSTKPKRNYPKVGLTFAAPCFS